MTLPEVLPVVLVAHDAMGEACVGRVRWVVEGCGASVVGCTADEFTGALAAPALADVGAYDAFLVVHFVGPLHDPDLPIEDHGSDPVRALTESLARVHASLSERFPGKQRVDQWVIHMVGQVVDEVERSFIERLAASDEAGFRGIIVTASATHASVTHDADEQACFASDMALAMIGSDLERHLADAEPVAWIGGSTSLTYAPRRLSEAVSAHHALRILEGHLLADSPHGDPAFDLGTHWVEDLDLDGEKEREILLTSSSGGSLLSRLRMDEIDWDLVPIISWSEVLTTQQALLASQELDNVREVIESNRRQRVSELKQRIIGGTFEELESAARFDSAIVFDLGVQVGLERAMQAIPEPPRATDHDVVERDRAKLRRFSRWLPFGPAVALRVFAAALGALVVVSALTGPTHLPILEHFTKPWGRVAALMTLVTGSFLYQRRLIATIRVRDRLNEALERQLIDLVEEWVAAARRQTLMELRSWIGLRPDWLEDSAAPDRPEQASTLVDWLAWLTHESQLSADKLRVRASERRDPLGPTSRFTCDLPLTSLLSTEELASQILSEAPEPADAARRLVLGVRPDCQPDSLRVVGQDELESLWVGWLHTRLETALWSDLGDLLSTRPTIRDAARQGLERNTTPAIVVDRNAPSVGTRHYLTLPGGRSGAAYRHLFSPDIEAADLPTRRVTDSLTDVLDIGLPDVALMVHLYAMDLDGARIADVSAEAHDNGNEVKYPGNEVDGPGGEVEDPGSDADDASEEVDIPSDEVNNPGSVLDDASNEEDNGGSEVDDASNGVDNPGSEVDCRADDAVGEG